MLGLFDFALEGCASLTTLTFIGCGAGTGGQAKGAGTSQHISLSSSISNPSCSLIFILLILASANKFTNSLISSFVISSSPDFKNLI